MDTQLVLGAVLIVLGVALFITVLFRALNRTWMYSVHEQRLLPLTSIALMFVGRWLVQ